ncbi:hypothetical protein JCM8097_006983 [Rhodosporidiobolus ruineniae]
MGKKENADNNVVANVEEVNSGALAQYRKADKTTSFAGRFYDALDIEDPEERRVVYKLDATVLLFGCLGYFIKYLDQANINSAYVSGMKEDLGMYGNELTTATTMWTIGYCIAQIPSNLILTRVSPRWWLPFLEIVWAFCTLLSFKVTNVKSLYAVRFFVGLAEAGFYPGAQYMLGSFYKPKELGKRAVFLNSWSNIGTLCSSALQAATYSGLSGKLGHTGWQWLFIIDAVISLPIAAMGFFLLPALPGQRESGKASFVLTTRDWEIIDRRMKEVNRAPPSTLSWKRAAKFALSWRVYVFPIAYYLWNNALTASTIMSIWLKSFNTVDTGTGIHYTVPQINHYVMPISGISCIAAWIVAYLSDGPLRGLRWPCIVFGALWTIANCISLAKLPLYENLTAHWFLYYTSQAAAASGGLMFAWASEVVSHDAEERGLVVGLMNNFERLRSFLTVLVPVLTFFFPFWSSSISPIPISRAQAYVMQCIVPNFVWKQTQYPRCLPGLYYSAALSACLIAVVVVIRYLHARDKKIALAALEFSPSTESYGANSPDSHSDKELDAAGEVAPATPTVLEERRY